MNEFYKNIKNTNITHEDAYNEIIGNLIINDLWQGLKMRNNLNAYDSETLFNGKMYRGNMYIFEYNANIPTKYTYNGNSVYFYDSLPIVLMTKELNGSFRGINLNFCNMALRTLLLNFITNLDYDFYFTDLAQKIAFNKNITISEKVYKFLSNDNAEQKIIDNLNNIFRGIDYSFIFRNYSINKIGKIRLIEPWQWEYIPYLNYVGTLKKETLEAIWTISGISNITL